MSHKLSKIIILVFLLAFPLVSFTLPSLPVFASGEGGGGNVDPTISHIIIDNAGIHYPTSADQNTAKFASNTLTLDNYNGGPIEISSDNDVTIMLKGNNTIDAGSQVGISSRTNLIIDGDGEIEIKNDHNGINLSYGQVLIINGGTTKILGCDTRDDGGNIVADYLLINKGVIDVSGEYMPDGGDGIFVQNGGKSSFKSLALEEQGVFNLNGGELKAADEGESVGEDTTIRTAFAVFNGGTASITSNHSIAMGIDGESSSPSFDDLNKVGAVLPKNNAKVEFNGGDITFSGDLMPFLIGFDNGYSEQKTYVNMSENMSIDPAFAKLARVVIDTGGEEPPSVMGLAYSDGADEIEVDPVNFTFSHVLKKVRIYKLATPAADDEENPNTVDTKIIALAFGTLFAIIAEGAIIADLYRRLFGYKKAISNINTSETEPEPTPDKPEIPNNQ